MSDELMHLFDEPTEPRTAALNIGEPAVNFLIESTWPEARAARAVVNGWYREFPSKNQIAPRLRAQSDVDHYGAIDELFVHSLIPKIGTDIRYEEFGRGPDFRIYEKGSLIAAVEVASFFMREDWQREWRNYGYVADALNERLQPKGLYLQVEPESLSRYPTKNGLVRFANEYIAGVESLVPHATDEMREPFEVPASYFQGEGFSIRFQLLPFRRSGPIEEQESVASVGPAIGGLVNSSQRLKGVLRGKLPGGYELEPVPYVIAVCNHDMFCSLETLTITLYGSEKVVFSKEGEEVRPFRSADGFFGIDQKHPEGRNRRVSGVVFISELASWAPGDAKSYFFPNPYAYLEWPSELLPTKHSLTPTDDSRQSWNWTPELIAGG